jgi:hypothetical protein
MATGCADRCDRTHHLQRPVANPLPRVTKVKPRTSDLNDWFSAQLNVDRTHPSHDRTRWSAVEFSRACHGQDMTGRTDQRQHPRVRSLLEMIQRCLNVTGRVRMPTIECTPESGPPLLLTIACVSIHQLWPDAPSYASGHFLPCV